MVHCIHYLPFLADGIIPYIPFVLHIFCIMASKLHNSSDVVLNSALSVANEIMSSTRKTLGFEQPVFTNIIVYCLAKQGTMEAAFLSKHLLCSILNVQE